MTHAEPETIDVTDNRLHHRYEARLDGTLAGVAAYRRQNRVTTFTHTRVDPSFEGHGVGSALARGALDDVRAAGGQVVPVCTFVRSWIGKHPDYADLVATPYRDSLD